MKYKIYLLLVFICTLGIMQAQNRNALCIIDSLVKEIVAFQDKNVEYPSGLYDSIKKLNNKEKYEMIKVIEDLYKQDNIELYGLAARLTSRLYDYEQYIEDEDILIRQKSLEIYLDHYFFPRHRSSIGIYKKEDFTPKAIERLKEVLEKKND